MIVMISIEYSFNRYAVCVVTQFAIKGEWILPKMSFCDLQSLLQAISPHES